MAESSNRISTAQVHCLIGRSSSNIPGFFDFELVRQMQGFIEGKYVPLGAAEDVTASMDIVEADSPEAAAALAAIAESKAKTA